MNNLALSRQHSQQQQHPYPLHHQNGGGSRKKKERPKSIGSVLLTDAENEQLVSILGRDRISLCAGVAQLLAAYPESPNIWHKANVGIALLIKDYLNRNYALCIYDIFKAEPLWSQVLYKNFQAEYYSNCPRFITFEGDHCVFALSFTDFEEAQKFKEALERRRDHELKSSRAHQNHRGSLNNNNHHSIQNQNMHSSAATKRVGPPPPPPPPIQMPPNNKIHQSPPQNGAIHTTGITNIGAVPHFGGNLQHLSSPKGKTKTSKNGKGNKGKERITKEDIGNPTNFIAHWLGCDLGRANPQLWHPNG